MVFCMADGKAYPNPLVKLQFPPHTGMSKSIGGLFTDMKFAYIYVLKTPASKLRLENPGLQNRGYGSLRGLAGAPPLNPATIEPGFSCLNIPV
jgi:hypothetical protein